MQKTIRKGLTFDDVLLIPAYSEIVPEDIKIDTFLTKKLRLNIPLMSAGSITDAQLAIAIARQGGLGVIHNDMSVKEQAAEVDRVKRSENGVITDPFSLSPNNYVYEAENLMARFRISGVPIIENGKLVGIITNRDLRFETDHNKKVYEVMTRENLITAHEGTTLEEAKVILTRHKIEKLPLLDKKGNLKGLITIKDIQKAIKYPHAAKDSQGRLLVGAAIGADYIERINALVEARADVIVLDSIHGHSRSAIECVRDIRAAYPDLQIVAGNATTKEATVALIEAGANAIKVGMWGGATGVGMPHITALMDCVEAARPYDIPVISDGGIRCPGRIAKALAVGANLCMTVDIFAECDESRERILCKSSTAEIISQFMKNLKSAMYYCGCKNIVEMQEKGQFITT